MTDLDLGQNQPRVGLGIRRGMFDDYEANLDLLESSISFVECAPENWIGVGGRWGKRFRALTERFQVVCHGLSLSIGSPAPLDRNYLEQLKGFLDEVNAKSFSDHLSYCGDLGHLYDLMPIPFTEEAIHYVSGRVRQVQDILERRIALEHVSYYVAPGQEMSEVEFINGVIEEADCKFLLDVNNIHVNSINHSYDPLEFLRQMPAPRSDYVHIAGHKVEDEDLRIDTHASAIIDPVYQLLRATYELYGVIPTLLERDFNFPPLEELLVELDQIAQIQSDSLNPTSQV